GDAEPGECVDDGAARSTVAQQRRFADLQPQSLYRNAAALDRVQALDQAVGILDLARRQIDADPIDDIAAIEQPPRFDLAHRLANDPRADFDDEPGLFEDRQKRGRRDEPVARMVPAQERLRADHPLVAEI